MFGASLAMPFRTNSTLTSGRVLALASHSITVCLLGELGYSCKPWGSKTKPSKFGACKPLEFLSFQNTKQSQPPIEVFVIFKDVATI